MRNKINQVANWIVHECDDSMGEVKWLLEELYSNAPTEKIDNDYDGVFEHLKHKKLLNFLGKDKKDAFLKELEDKDKE